MDKLEHKYRGTGDLFRIEKVHKSILKIYKNKELVGLTHFSEIAIWVKEKKERELKES